MLHVDFFLCVINWREKKNLDGRGSSLESKEIDSNDSLDWQDAGIMRGPNMLQ